MEQRPGVPKPVVRQTEKKEEEGPRFHVVDPSIDRTLLL